MSHFVIYKIINSILKLPCRNHDVVQLISTKTSNLLKLGYGDTIVLVARTFTTYYTQVSSLNLKIVNHVIHQSLNSKFSFGGIYTVEAPTDLYYL
jgi:hypothetical protein